MFQIYILYAPAKDAYYIGQTADLDARLEQHRLHHFKGASTVIADD